MMGVLSAHLLDGSAQRVYQPDVDVAATPQETSAKGIHSAPRRRRRPPSLPEQQRRTARIVPWAETWKALKAAGRWQ